jgi:hypothetical protein
MIAILNGALMAVYDWMFIISCHQIKRPYYGFACDM